MRAFFNPDERNFSILFEKGELELLKNNLILSGSLYYKPEIQVFTLVLSMVEDQNFDICLDWNISPFMHRLKLSKDYFLKNCSWDDFQKYEKITKEDDFLNLEINFYSEENPCYVTAEQEKSFEMFEFCYLKTA